MLRTPGSFCQGFAPAAAAACLLAAAPGAASDGAGGAPAVAIAGEYKIDGVAVLHGPREGVRRVDYASISADVSLDRAIGWSGARLFVHGIASTGQAPNDLAGTMQGINNSEVAGRRAKLYELYLEREFTALPATVRFGFSDLNTQFYANDAAAQLLAPAFGIGSELSATGPNGPSIFPSTALTAQLKITPVRDGYVQVAAVNAEAGVPGDAGGVPRLLGKGALVIGEIGTTRQGKIALGAWAYTQRQPDIRATRPDGMPAARRARGAYALIEQPLASGGTGALSAFLRAGISDGDTTPYTGGWQAGLAARGFLRGRPGASFSAGVNQAFLSRKHRLNAAGQGQPTGPRETGIEMTYADSLAPWLTIQPDLQHVWNATRGPGARDASVFTLRLIFTLPTP